jgi:AcrR family transcriptional regulator
MKNVERTKASLIDAARRAFAEDGYERTTVRSVASKAGVNPALINRYFGGKEGLFATAVQIDLQLPDLAPLPKADIGPALVQHFFDRWDGREDDILRTLIRTSGTHPEAAAHMRRVLGEQVRPLVERLSGGNGAPERAALVATQILGLAYFRYVLEAPDLVLSPKTATSVIGATINHYLFGALPLSDAEPTAVSTE